MDQRRLLRHVVAWAQREDNVRAVVLTGSVARGAFDAWSDLDLELYARDPAPLLDNDAWYRQFGDVLVVEALENPGWHPTRLVYYENGKIDFMVAPTSVKARGVRYDRPFQLLVDKDNEAGAFQQETPDSRPPTAREFRDCVEVFYAAAIMWAAQLARNDPWAAKIRDWDSKQMLLRMIEWDQKARKGWNLDTFHLGAHLRDWADAELVDRAGACWSGFGREDSAGALTASLTMFDELSARTAAALGLEPFDSRAVRRRVQRLLETPPKQS